MCGIIGYIGPKDVVPVLIDGLKKLEYRGYDSAGVAVVGAGRHPPPPRSRARSRALEEALRESPTRGRLRARPHPLGDPRPSERGERPSPRRLHGRIVVVHNGIIENYLALKSDAEGRRPRLPDRDRHRSHRPSGRKTLPGIARGRRPGGLGRAWRARSPSARCRGQGSRQDRRGQDRPAAGRRARRRRDDPVSSDINPILAHTPRVAFLEDGEMAVLDAAGRPVHGFHGPTRSRRKSSRSPGTP